MKTRDRILSAARLLFNHQSAANVTTNAIADESDISVGNLYYHFKNKEDILLALFRQFRENTHSLLVLPDDAEPLSLSQWALWWEQWFVQVDTYHFLFHNQQYLTQQNSHLKYQYQQLLSKLNQVQQHQLLQLKSQGDLVATQGDIFRIAREVTLIAIFWRDFMEIQKGSFSDADSPYRSALHQVIGLLLPYMKVDEQIAMEQFMMKEGKDINQGC